MEFDFGEALRQAAYEATAPESPLLDMLAEEPVPLSTFVQDKLFLNNPPLSEVQYDAVRHIERIYYPSMYPALSAEFESGKVTGRLHVGPASAWREERYWSQPARMVNFATLQWGKGSGKDHICRIASMRIAYLLMCLESPQTYYGMPDQDTIHLLNVASSSAQAQQAFFIPIMRAVKRGWFKDKCTARQNSISYAKNVESISGHSDAESQEGLNLLLGIADEIDAFKSKKEMVTRKGASAREPTKSAEGILNMMKTSGATRFPEVFKMVRISYPRYLGSTIQNLTADARKDLKERGEESRHFVSGPLATWQVNPRVVGKEAFAQDYRDDPITARAKYECKPARAINPYFRNTQAVDSAFVVHNQLPVKVEYVIEQGVKRSVWVPRYTFSDSFYPVRGAAYVMHADLAVQGDRAGIAMAHVIDYSEHEAIAEDEDGAVHSVREVRPHVKVDFTIHFSADIAADPPREIQIRWARQLAFELIRRGFNIRLFSFDTFQCMSGDTEIPLLDGTTKTLRELEGSEPFWLYSNVKGRIVPGLCTKAWKTGRREDMLAVELDNGEVVKTTSDHRFMLRDGSYRRADALSPGDSLMPLYRRIKKVSPTSKNEYEQIRHPEPDGSGQHWRFTHSMVSHYTYGVMPKGWVTHHKNCDPRDNRPENLEQMTSADHTAWHNANNISSTGQHPFEAAWADPEWSAAHKERLAAHRRADQTGVTGPASRAYRQEITIDTVREAHAACIADGVTPTKGEMGNRLGCTQPLLYSRVRDAGYRSWKGFRDAHEEVSEAALYQRAWKARQKKVNNHKVVAIRPAPAEDVYDLQVDEHHNFAVGAGVFVHNSKDSMQILEDKGIETEKVSTDMSEEPWRNLRDLMYEGRITIPRERYPDEEKPGSFLLRDELLSLSRLPNGRVDHPADGSKDIADAVACAALMAVKVGGREERGGARRHYEAPSIQTGSPLHLPYGASLKRIWETRLPSPF